MSWNSTIKRKKSLRDSYAEKIKRNGMTRSKAQRTRLARYNEMRREFLADPVNEFCEICKRRREAGENITLNFSSEIHHKFLRTGKNIFRGFIASCFPCREWPHQNPRLAREFGLLA